MHTPLIPGLAFAEKLQAIASPLADFIGELDARYINCDNGLTTIIDVDMRRGRDFQTLAQFVYCCWFYPERMAPSAPKMEQWLSNDEEPDGVFKTAMKEALTKFWHIGDTKSLNYPFTRIQKRVAPIEFVFIGELLTVMAVQRVSLRYPMCRSDHLHLARFPCGGMR